MLRRHPRTTLCIVAALCGAALVVAAPRRDIDDSVGGPGSGSAERLWAETSIAQTVRPHREPLTALAILVSGVPDEQAQIGLRVTKDGKAQPLFTVEGPVKKFLSPDRQALRFPLPYLRDVRGDELRFTLVSQGLPKKAGIPIRYEIADAYYPDGQRFVNNQARPGDLAFRLSAREGIRNSWRERLLSEHGGLWFVLLGCGLLTSLLAFEFWEIHRGAVMDRRRWIRCALCSSLLFALLYAFPLFARLGFWGPDESDWPEVASHHAAARQTLAAGQFPWWNPYMCGGTPHFANPQTYFLSPTFLFSLLFGEVVGPKLAIPVVLAAGLLGMMLLARTLGLGGFPGLLASSVFLFSGFTTTHLANGQFLWLTLAWVPWVLVGFLRSLRGSLWWAVVAAGFLVLIFLEGRVYLVAYAAVFLTLLALVQSLQQRAVRPLVVLFLVGAFTILGSAWKLAPTLAFLADAETSLPNTDGVPMRGLAAAFLRRDVRPRITDRIGAVEIPRHEYAAYIGALPLLLSVMSLHPRTFRRAVPYFVIGGVFLLFSTQPREVSVLEHLPLVRELRNPSRMLSMVVLSVAVLSGLGLATLKDTLMGRVPVRLARAVVALVATLALADLLRVGWVNFPRVFTVPPHPHAFSEAGFFQTNQPETQAANGYPAVAAGKGAKDFCPAVLRAWRPASLVRAREDASYQGEAYALRGARATLGRWTPNTFTVNVDAPAPDTVFVNQQFDRSWSAAPLTIQNADTLLAVDVPSGQTTIHFRYRPPYLALGSALTLLTITAGLVMLGYRSRTRP